MTTNIITDDQLMADALKATGLSYSLCDKFIAIPIVVRYRVLGFEESGVRS